MKFEELNLPEYIIDALKKQEFSEATDIQSKCIPAIREGKDVVGTSQTGSGKTYAFGIPAVEQIDMDPYVQVLVVCPTRELASQVSDEIRKITSFKEGLKIVPIFGGSSMERQIFALKKGARIVIGTPGRLNDHIRRKTLKLGHVKMVVLDEADEMLDMGFREDIEDILKVTNPDRQTVMFSATMPKAILEITKNYMKDPVKIEGDTQGQAQTFIDQFYVSVDKKAKTETVAHLLERFKPMRSIIFCNTKIMVDELTNSLCEQGIGAVGLHGDMRQNERRKAMMAVKDDKIGILIATDVAARGIDIKNVDLIINYDIPNNSEYYIHRIGRTARAGKAGAAYTIINSKAQLGTIDQLRRETKNEIPEYECDLSTKFNTPKKPEARKDVFRKGKTHVTAHGAKPAPAGESFDKDFKKVFGAKRNFSAPREERDKGDYFKTREERAKGDYFKPREEGAKRDYSKPREDGAKRDYSKPREEGAKRDYSKPREDGAKRDYSKPREDGAKRDFTKTKDYGAKRDFSKPREDGAKRDFSKPKENGVKRDYSKPSENKSKDFKKSGEFKAKREYTGKKDFNTKKI